MTRVVHNLSSMQKILHSSQCMKCIPVDLKNFECFVTELGSSGLLGRPCGTCPPFFGESTS